MFVPMDVEIKFISGNKATGGSFIARRPLSFTPTLSICQGMGGDGGWYCGLLYKV